MLLCSTVLSTHAQEKEFSETFSAFLDKHGVNDLLDYASVDQSEIDIISSHLKTMLSDRQIESYPVHSQINVYNFLVIQKIMDNYPIRSVQDIKGFFDNKLEFGTQSFSLDECEKNLIRDTGNAGIHLLLNCGAVSCPPLQYIESDASMPAQIRYALDSDKMIRVNEEDGTVAISRIFNWYVSDFGSEKDVIDWISGKLTTRELEGLKLNYLEYNWALNEAQVDDYLLIYPTKLYRKGAYELKIFNNYYTQTENDIRSNFFSSFFQFQIGTDKNLNWGFDVKFRSVSQGKLSLFDALNFRNEEFHTDQGVNRFSRIGISGIGPTVRYQPFKDKANINILHSIYWVPMDDAEGNDRYGYSDFQGLQIFNRLFIEKELSLKRRLFFDFGLWIENLPFFRENDSFFTQVQLPVTAIYSYFPSSKFSVYGLANAAPKFVYNKFSDNNSQWKLNAYGQLGVGIKYYLVEFLELELLYTYFYDGTPGRKAQTFNLGIRFFRF